MSQQRSEKHSPVTVYLPPKVANNFEAVLSVQKNILNRLGCGGCYSGRDMFFKYLEEEVFLASEKGEVTQIASPVAGG